MTREDIIRIAQEAHGPITARWWDMDVASLERFAALVIKSLKPSLQTEFKKMFMEGAAAEREACAKVCEENAHNYLVDKAWCAEAIRARGRDAP